MFTRVLEAIGWIILQLKLLNSYVLLNSNTLVVYYLPIPMI